MLQVELEAIRFAKEEDIPKQEKDPSLIDHFQFDDVTPANITQVNEWMSSLEDSEGYTFKYTIMSEGENYN